MPEPPRKGEPRDAFISRCISHLIKNEDKTQEQASGQCYDMWRQKHGKVKIKVKRKKR